MFCHLLEFPRTCSRHICVWFPLGWYVPYFKSFHSSSLLPTSEKRQCFAVPAKTTRSWSDSSGLSARSLSFSFFISYLQLHGVAEGIKYLHFMDPPIIHGDIRGVSSLVLKWWNTVHRGILKGKYIDGWGSKSNSIRLWSCNNVGYQYCNVWDWLSHQRQYRMDGTGNVFTFKTAVILILGHLGILCP